MRARGEREGSVIPAVDVIDPFIVTYGFTLYKDCKKI